MFSGFYTTDKGHQYLAKSMAGKTLVLTRGQFGNGALPEDVTITTVTALIAPLGELPISKQNTMNNCTTTTTQFSNKVNGTVLEPFHLMEAGLFGKLKNADGTDDEESPEALLFYANALTKDKADYIPGVLTEFLINWPLTISSATNVTVEINESLVFPTLEEVKALIPVNAEAGGTGSALTIESDMKELKDGQQFMIELTEDLEAGATLSHNDGTAYPIKNANGTVVTEGQQKAGTTLNVIFSEEQGCWYILGGGSMEIATEEEAKAGTDNLKVMTPLRVSNYVDKILGDVNKILDSINGEVI